MGLVQLSSIKLAFIHFPINPAFQEPLVYMLRYKFREAADLQGGEYNGTLTV